MLNKKKRKMEEINASSMADIAFLLLIFFLVTTTIASDKGIPMLLPPKRDKNDESEVKMNDRNVFKVLVNSRNQLLVEDDIMRMEDLRTAAKKFINNNGSDKESSDNPQEAAISYKTDRGTKYSIYIRILDELRGAYNELRAEKLGISLEQYLKFDEEAALKENALLKKVEIFSQRSGKNMTAREYLNFNQERIEKAIASGDKSKVKELAAYKAARASGRDLFIEKYYEVSRFFPMRISEAEPTKIGE